MSETLARRDAATFFGASAFMLAFAALPHLSVPRLWYHPIERAWTFETHAAGMAMGFYGRVLFAIAVAAVLTVAARAFWRVLCSPRGKRMQLAAFVAILVTTTMYVLTSDFAWIAG